MERRGKRALEAFLGIAFCNHETFKPKAPGIAISVTGCRICSGFQKNHLNASVASTKSSLNDIGHEQLVNAIS